MFNGSIPIILDSLKQHYFIDRDGKLFRHILNYMRFATLMLPDNFNEWELLIEEAKYFELFPMVKATEAMKKERMSKQSATVSSASPSSASSTSDGEGYIEVVAVNICPDLGERISLSAERSLIEEIFPELNSALMDSRNSGWNMDNRYVIRFPLNGFCKLNSVQVFSRLINHGFRVIASTGGGVEGQQFSDYLFCKKVKSVQ